MSVIEQPRLYKRRCAQCRAPGRFRLLELLWRLDGKGAWHWVVGWWCAACRAAVLDFITAGAQVTIVDDDLPNHGTGESGAGTVH